MTGFTKAVAFSLFVLIITLFCNWVIIMGFQKGFSEYRKNLEESEKKIIFMMNEG